jgi:hypothetical protein
MVMQEGLTSVIHGTAKQRKTAAYHEAGHADRVLTLPCGYATIRPDYAKAIAGYVITPEPYACRKAVRR